MLPAPEPVLTERAGCPEPGEVMDGWVGGGGAGKGRDGIVFNNKICMQARIPG